MNLKDIPIHEKIVLKMGVTLFSKHFVNVIDLGEALVSKDSDLIADGGIWIWDYNTNEVFVSPKFCNVLGFNYGELPKDVSVFDRADKAKFAVGYNKIMELIEDKSEGTFINEITYKSKENKDVKIICSGTIFYKENKPFYLLGTHKLNG